MAITNIGTLQSAVESWLERTLDDALFLEFANSVATVLMRGIQAADGRSWIVPPVRIREMLTTTTLTTSGGSIALPADWLAFERVWIDSNDGGDLSYIPIGAFESDPDAKLTGTPKKYTLDGSTLYVAPTTDATLQVSYYQELGAFTGDSSTDAILTNHPRVYLAGCLAEACGWLGDYQREDRELAKMGASVRALNAESRQAQVSGGVLRMRPRSVS